MNKILFTAAFFFTIVSTVLSQTKNFIDQPYIEVGGYADTLITPNQIFIKIIIAEKDTRDKVSVEEQESKMIAALKELGINTETDLTTSDMLSSYRFHLLRQKDILKSKEYILKVSDAATASRVFIQLEDLGISNTSIDRVNHTDLENIKNMCRTRSIINARNKGVALTKPINQTIGNAIQITDTETNLENQLQGRASGILIRGISSFKQEEKYQPPKIEFEKIKVSATVSVKFILK